MPRRLSRLGQRLREATANTPLFFVGMVIAIAVVFKIGIGAVKPAAADELRNDPAAAHVAHVAVPAAAPTPVVAVPTPAVEPDPTVGAPKTVLPRRKSRTHGKR